MLIKNKDEIIIENIKYYKTTSTEIEKFRIFQFG